MAGRDLTPEQNEALRRVLQRMKDERYKTETALGEAIGLNQATISGFMNRRQGTSWGVVRRVAKLEGLSVDEVLGGPTRRESTFVPDESSEALERVIHAGSYLHGVVLAGRAYRSATGEDLTEQGWKELLDGFQREALRARERAELEALRRPSKVDAGEQLEADRLARIEEKKRKKNVE